MLGHVGFECARGFVVESLELRLEASRGEEVVRAFVGGEDFWSCFVFHWLDMDEIAIVFVEYEHVAVAVGGGLEEASSLVGEDLAGGRCVVSVDVVGSRGGGSWIGRVEVGEFFELSEGGWCGR